MAHEVVITEKTSQAQDVWAAVGTRYGAILPAEGHLIDLAEPEDVVPAWKMWSCTLLRPDGGLYGTRPASGGNKATKGTAATLGVMRLLPWMGIDRWLARISARSRT